MSGPSTHRKGFTPLELMEGFSITEVFNSMKKLDDILEQEFGSDQEIRVVVLSFLLGRALKTSKIDTQKAFLMTKSAREVTI